ncbi:hypothetical protein ADK59_20450 [Streptomyces sp. XY332]|nr:hypothetical protein ADK59_20450 [Streptomyces sp. XY332]
MQEDSGQGVGVGGLGVARGEGGARPRAVGSVGDGQRDGEGGVQDVGVRSEGQIEGTGDIAGVDHVVEEVESVARRREGTLRLCWAVMCASTEISGDQRLSGASPTPGAAPRAGG